jgi:sulfite reductase alpha subunit-like flavoprotein
MKPLVACLSLDSIIFVYLKVFNTCTKLYSIGSTCTMAAAVAAASGRTENVYVLFGSQTGNSEDYARTFAKELPNKLSPSEIQRLTGTSEEITLQAKAMQLDDFLEMNKADWTRLVIIFVSSYGVGQAPLGCYRFRDLCDAWKERKTTNLLQGVQFAICGLGDSSYTTFFQNPTAINEALLQVGATRLGDIGQADAQGTGDKAQAPVVERWKQALWKPLAEAVVKQPLLSDDKLKAMQDFTCTLCAEINPEFEMPLARDSQDNSTMNNNPHLSMILATLVVVLAMLAYFALQKQG